ncbi:hypothetical protein GCM10010116_35110 [Microbispora rosea subsp. aerata]|nr:hypothetical protein [Microbispora rosea]GGO17377.1 hypothetical protein GCM10010116_35110 [Microbispora rosea subsp. aerata]GIH56525.1 hypothetical protein Mro02_34390 [Microbispora rosea subsp. aerata]GLJ81946.1 hypothetical protein GCM10017588_06710 [Microbispora rosea subsp. aerata]
MRKPAILALSAAVTMALTTLAGGAAQAQARTGAASATASAASPVRYAWLKSCHKKDDYHPCGSWHLLLRNGRDVVLKDAQVFPRTAKGKIDKHADAPLSISGDGRHVSYFRKKDGRLVVRDLTTNKVRTLPRSVSKLPKGIGMGDLSMSLSRDGGLIAIEYYDGDDKIPSLLVDVRTGKVRKIRADESILGFSPDGTHLLASRGTAENTSRFSVYDQDGRQTNSQVVPQVVANNSPTALADDGSTVAVLITTSSGGKRLRLYDLSNDTVGEAVNVRVPKKEFAKRLEWTADGGLKLWETLDSREGDIDRVVVRSLDPATGATATLDSFKVKSSLWNWWLPGE